jgi:methionyl-tRNA formyltransferase
MRLIFMGTPDFSVPALAALINAGHDIACVYSQPPRRAGRGQSERPSPVHVYAEQNGIEVRHPASLKDANTQNEFIDLKADAAVVVAYGLLLPPAVLSAPRLGCLNIHASLLPRWRGAAPIQRAIMAGDEVTGVNIMQMDEGLDTGAILLGAEVPITEETTGGSLHDALSALGASLIVDALAGCDDGSLFATPQPDDGATYASKLTRDDGLLDWNSPSVELARTVRALSPLPGAWFSHGDERIRVLEAELRPENGAPGIVLDERLTIACGTNSMGLLRVQRPGRKALDAADFLRGFDLPAGSRLG